MTWDLNSAFKWLITDIITRRGQLFKLNLGYNFKHCAKLTV